MNAKATPATQATTDPAAVRREQQARDDNGAAYSLLGHMEERLKELGIELEAACGEGDVWTYTVHQTHGTFTTRGEALQWAVRNLVRIDRR